MRIFVLGAGGTGSLRTLICGFDARCPDDCARWRSRCTALNTSCLTYSRLIRPLVVRVTWSDTMRRAQAKRLRFWAYVLLAEVFGFETTRPGSSGSSRYRMVKLWGSLLRWSTHARGLPRPGFSQTFDSMLSAEQPRMVGDQPSNQPSGDRSELTPPLAGRNRCSRLRQSRRPIPLARVDHPSVTRGHSL